MTRLSGVAGVAAAVCGGFVRIGRGDGGGGGIWRDCQEWPGRRRRYVAALSGLVEVMAAVAAYGEIVKSGRGGGGGMWRLCQDWLR
jgi:hypothetical protein